MCSPLVIFLRSDYVVLQDVNFSPLLLQGSCFKTLPDLFSLEWNAKHDVSFGTQSPRNRDNTFPGSASGNLIWKKNNPKTDEFCKTDFLCERIHYANWQSDSVWGVTQESIGFGLLRSAIG